MPFVSQAFGDGSHCAEASPPAPRRAELRLMCSPDGEFHVIVGEPEQCVYQLELYVPALCALPGFAVEPPPGGWYAAAGAGGGSATGEPELGPEYALPPDLGDDDPYADPDDTHDEL